MAYQISFPVLLKDGAVEESEVLTVGRFFALAQEINRGLDNASEMMKSKDSEGLKKEFNRNCLKAKALIGEEDQGSLYARTKLIVDAKIALNWWQYKKGG